MLTLPGKYLNMKVPLRSSLYEEEGWPLKPIKLSSFTDQPCNAKFLDLKNWGKHAGAEEKDDGADMSRN